MECDAGDAQNRLVPPARQITYFRHEPGGMSRSYGGLSEFLRNRTVPILKLQRSEIGTNSNEVGERLGVRESGGLVLVGGLGRVQLANAEIDLSRFTSIGLAAQDVFRVRELVVPDAGVLVVENLTPFHICLEQLRDSKMPLLVWSGGFPNRATGQVLQMAASAGARIRVWCDIDLGGVRICRMIQRLAAQRAEPALMSPEVLGSTRTRRALSPEQRAAVARDVGRWPEALLAETLRAVLECGAGVEQEALLDRIRHLSEQ